MLDTESNYYIVVLFLRPTHSIIICSVGRYSDQWAVILSDY